MMSKKNMGIAVGVIAGATAIGTVAYLMMNKKMRYKAQKAINCAFDEIDTMIDNVTD